MNLQKIPYRIDFAGNSPEFVVRTTPNFSDGRPFSRTFIVTSLPAGQLVMEIDGETLTWTLSANPGDGLYEMPAVASNANLMLDALEARVVYNPVLNREFAATCRIIDGRLQLKITGREPGAHTVTFRHTGSPLFVTTLGNIVGGNDRNPKPNYRVKAWYSILRDGGRIEPTPEMLFEDSGGAVRIPTGILAPYFGKPDIPAWQQPFTAQPCPANTLAVRLMAGEMHADDTGSAPVIRNMIHSDRITLVNGELQPYAAMNNIPDWTALNDTHFHLKSGLDIFGQDHRGTVTAPADAVQYIYVYNYSAEAVTADIAVTLVYEDGLTDDGFTYSATFRPGTNRVEASLDALELDSTKRVVRWTVSVGGGPRRTFVVRDFEHGFHTFLMLNALNLYETFIVERLSREEQTEGERRVVAGTDGYGTTDRQTVFTAHCAPRNPDGLRLLRSAFAKQDNLLLEGRFAWRIDMVPGSLTVTDGQNDLTEAEFKFRLREKVNRDVQVIDAGSDLDDAQIMKTDTVVK